MKSIEEIREQLKESKLDLATIASDTGLTFWWLHKFVRGVIKDPGYEKVTRLVAYLDK